MRGAVIDPPPRHGTESHSGNCSSDGVRALVSLGTVAGLGGVPLQDGCWLELDVTFSAAGGCVSGNKCEKLRQRHG